MAAPRLGPVASPAWVSSTCVERLVAIHGTRRIAAHQTAISWSRTPSQQPWRIAFSPTTIMGSEDRTRAALAYEANVRVGRPIGLDESHLVWGV